VRVCAFVCRHDTAMPTSIPNSLLSLLGQVVLSLMCGSCVMFYVSLTPTNVKSLAYATMGYIAFLFVCGFLACPWMQLALESSTSGRRRSLLLYSRTYLRRPTILHSCC
jgi:hypothetical protein